MKLDRLDVPDPRPLDGAFLFAGEAFAGFTRLTIHRGQYLRIQVALIERGFAAPDDCSHDAWESLETTDGTNRIGMLTRDRADLERKLGGGGQRIASRLHWR